MKLPQNFAREWVSGCRSSGHAVNGWRVRIGNKGVFLSCSLARNPGSIRKRLETVLGIDNKPKKTPEDLIIARSRISASQKRIFRNRLARGEVMTPPWELPRTVRAVANEERSLDIAQRWQRMGEFKR